MWLPANTTPANTPVHVASACEVVGSQHKCEGLVLLAAVGLQEVDVELDDAVSGALIIKRLYFCGKERAAFTVMPLLLLGRQGSCSSRLG